MGGGGSSGPYGQPLDGDGDFAIGYISEDDIGDLLIEQVDSYEDERFWQLTQAFYEFCDGSDGHRCAGILGDSYNSVSNPIYIDSYDAHEVYPISIDGYDPDKGDVWIGARIPTQSSGEEVLVLSGFNFDGDTIEEVRSYVFDTYDKYSEGDFYATIPMEAMMYLGYVDVLVISVGQMSIE